MATEEIIDASVTSTPPAAQPASRGGRSCRPPFADGFVLCVGDGE
jgi:hypothetical protein